MADQPTVIPQFTLAQWTEALLADFPIPWTSQAARMPGGVLYAMMGACAANLQMINDFLTYGFDFCRLDTCEGDQVDIYADDFYGVGGLPRKTGESDASYKQRIQAGLFIPYTTREAFTQAITQLTGIAPRLISPWIAGQTAAYDWYSYYDIDDEAYPALYGDSSLSYQAFVIADLPPATGSEQATAIWGYDAGAAYDIYTGTYWNLQAANFTSQADLDALINRIKAFGITIWRKYLSANQLPFPIPNSSRIATGLSTIPVGLQTFNGPYIVIASCNWNANLYVTNLTANGFTINATTPSPSGSILNYVVLPVSLPGVGRLGLTEGQITATIPCPSNAGSNKPIITPGFNTGVTIESISTTEVVVNLSTPATNGDILYYYFMPAAQAAVIPVTLSSVDESFISIPNLPNCCPFVMPYWNSINAVTATATGIEVTYSDPPPEGSSQLYAWFPIPGG